VAGPAAGLLDADPHRVLVAIHAHLQHALDMAGGLALAPQLAARATVVPGLAGGDGLTQCLVVHVRDHQHIAGHGIGGDAGDKTGGIERRFEGQPFFGLM